MPNWHRRPWQRAAPIVARSCIGRTIPESPGGSRMIFGKRFHSASVSVVPGADAEVPVSPCGFLDARCMLAWWWFLLPAAGGASMPGSPGYRPAQECLCVPCIAGVHSGARHSLPPRSGGRPVGVSCRSLIRQHSRCHFASLLADRTRNKQWPVCAF